MTRVIFLFILQEKCRAEVFIGKHGRSVSCCGWNHWWGVRERKVYPTRIVNMSSFWSFCLIFIGKMMIGISIIKIKKCLVCKMPWSHKQSQSCLYRTLPLLVVFPVARVILESDPQQVLQKVNYRVRFLSVIPQNLLYQYNHWKFKQKTSVLDCRNTNQCRCLVWLERLHQDLL